MGHPAGLCLRLVLKPGCVFSDQGGEKLYSCPWPCIPGASSVPPSVRAASTAESEVGLCTSGGLGPAATSCCCCLICVVLETDDKCSLLAPDLLKTMGDGTRRGCGGWVGLARPGSGWRPEHQTRAALRPRPPCPVAALWAQASWEASPRPESAAEFPLSPKKVP